jgi:hypothetical protein
VSVTAAPPAQSDTVAEDRCDMDDDLIQKAGFETLLSNVRAQDDHIAAVCRLLRGPHRLFDIDVDELAGLARPGRAAFDAALVDARTPRGAAASGSSQPLAPSRRA